MSRGRPIVWTREMDDVVRRDTVRAAAALLEVSVSSVRSRRQQILPTTGRLATARRKGGRRGSTSGPGAPASDTIQLFGLGYSRETIAEWRRVTRQAVDQVLNRYVFTDPGRRRWCCICVAPFVPAASDVITCSRECEKQYKANRAGA